MMRLVFLGTSASEGYPNAFCGCINCERARELGGPSLRKRCSALIDDDLLIDLGPDLMAATQIHGISLARLRFCLQSHEHDDHLEPVHFISRSHLRGVEGVPRLNFYATRGAIERSSIRLAKYLPPGGLLDTSAAEGLNLSITLIEPFQPFSVGRYRVTPLRANHDPAMTVMLFAVEAGGRAILYGTDTGVLPEETWRALSAGGFRFNLVALDHTWGLGPTRPGHMNSDEFREQIARLRGEGLLADKARVFATHIGHRDNPPHPELVEFARENGYEIAHDGLLVAL